MWSAIRSSSGMLLRHLPWITGFMDITGHWDCPCISRRKGRFRAYTKRQQKRQRSAPPGQLRILYLSCGMGLSLWNYLIWIEKYLKKQTKNPKKVLDRWGWVLYTIQGYENNWQESRYPPHLGTSRLWPGFIFKLHSVFVMSLDLVDRVSLSTFFISCHNSTTFTFIHGGARPLAS